MTIKVLPGQTFFDISLQYTGIIDNAFPIAKSNGKSVSDVLLSADIITIPSGLQTNNKVLQYYSARNILPATGISKKENEVFPYEFAISF